MKTPKLTYKCSTILLSLFQRTDTERVHNYCHNADMPTVSPPKYHISQIPLKNFHHSAKKFAQFLTSTRALDRFLFVLRPTPEVYIVCRALTHKTRMPISRHLPSDHPQKSLKEQITESLCSVIRTKEGTVFIKSPEPNSRNKIRSLRRERMYRNAPKSSLHTNYLYKFVNYF